MATITRPNPNQINPTSSKCCVYCGKMYNNHSTLLKHIVLCEYLNQKTKITPTINSIDTDNHENNLVPSPKIMYDIIVSLHKKVQQLEKKVESLKNTQRRENKNLDVYDWLNTKHIPQNNFDTFNEQITIEDNDIEILIKGTFMNMFKAIIQRAISNVTATSNIAPIYACLQKPNTFYIYNANTKWCEMSDQMYGNFLNKIFTKIMRVFIPWKRIHLEKDDSDAFSIQCAKATIKLMEVDFKNPQTLNKAKSILRDIIKTNFEY